MRDGYFTTYSKQEALVTNELLELMEIVTRVSHQGNE